jgi:superfamily II DNA or RNA helicase
MLNLALRPTESLTVFTQQVGRSLRLYSGKDHCVNIDLLIKIGYLD